MATAWVNGRPLGVGMTSRGTAPDDSAPESEASGDAEPPGDREAEAVEMPDGGEAEVAEAPSGGEMEAPDDCEVTAAEDE